MKLYCICFTKEGAKLQQKVMQALEQSRASQDNELQNNHSNSKELQSKGLEKFDFYPYLSPRIYEDLQGEPGFENTKKAALSEFCELAWHNGQAILFIGAAGIAIRGMAPYITKKDQDPALLLMDEKGQFVIPLLSGHIGGANRLAAELSQKLGAQLVLTTATDVQQKLAIDSWAVGKEYKVDNITQIASVSSAVLEDRPVLLIGPANDLAELKTSYPHFIQKEILPYEKPEGAVLALKQAHPQMPMVLISPFESKDQNLLHLVPKAFVVGLGARRNKDPEEFMDFFEQSLQNEGIHQGAVLKICSIDLKADEVAFLVLGERKNLLLEFFTKEELALAENYTDHEFVPSQLVHSVTGVDNVCERACVVGAAMNKKNSQINMNQNENKINIELIKNKTKHNGMTIAISKL